MTDSANYVREWLAGQHRDLSRDHISALLDERDALRATIEWCLWRAEPHDPRVTGRSSNALAVFALGGPEPGPDQYPFDSSDLGACERTFDAAPQHLQERMALILDQYRAALNADD